MLLSTFESTKREKEKEGLNLLTHSFGEKEEGNGEAGYGRGH